MIDYNQFVTNPKSLLIAPAGYGKTYTIAKCLEFTTGKQLILTHTHAGIASIKEKIKKHNIPNKSFNIETITSFAQKYVLAFYRGKDIPDQSNSKEYYPFILDKALEIIQRKPILDMLAGTYSGIFVDEYQDCTVLQDKLILVLSEKIRTRILGDYLQGIFGFNEPLVDMENAGFLSGFIESQYELIHPQRWLNGNNANLGLDLKVIREQLVLKNKLDLRSYKSIEVHIIEELDLYNIKKDYYKKISRLRSETSLLIIHPDMTSVNPRLKIIKMFNNGFVLLESIDDKSFYSISKLIDLATVSDIEQVLKEISMQLFNKTGIDNWFNEKGLKNKIKPDDKLLLEPLKRILNELKKSISFQNVSKFLQLLKKFPDIKCYRRELLNSICVAIDDAELNKTLVYDAMIKKRNFVRRIGRKVTGRCIGTTLLTKGLEFDTVVIINAHKFKCPKHLYVALTRASKKLIIFTDNPTLDPYN